MMCILYSKATLAQRTQSRIYIAIEPAQLLKGPSWWCLALPCISQESMEREKQAHLKAVASDRPRKPVRMESSLYLKEIGEFLNKPVLIKEQN